ncbi:MAG: CBS domain-containing protein [Acidobacteriota bacterium]
MKTVSQLLENKGREVYSVTPGTSVYEALSLMADKNIGALVVLEGDDLAGIFSERDYARKVILKGKSSKETPVSEIMTRKVICVSPDSSVEQCMALMTGQRIRHLPVVADKRLTGVISIGDVVKAIISDQQFMMEQLQNYIIGLR